MVQAKVSTKVYKNQEPLSTSITLDGVEPEMHTIVECWIIVAILTTIVWCLEVCNVDYDL